MINDNNLNVEAPACTEGQAMVFPSLLLEITDDLKIVKIMIRGCMQWGS